MNNMGLGMRIRTLIGGFALLLVAADLFAASDVQSVRLWRAPDNTRLVFDLSGPVEHKIFTLTAPDRLVIDVTGANLKAQLDQLALKNTPVAALRAGQHDANTLRVLLPGGRVVQGRIIDGCNEPAGGWLLIDVEQNQAVEQSTDQDGWKWE